MIGFEADFYLACDGEELLGARYDGNACELTSRGSVAGNEEVTEGGYDALPSEHAVGRAVLAALRTLAPVAMGEGWICEPTLRMEFHVCPACAVAWAELSGEEREAARAARWRKAKARQIGAAPC